MLKYLIDCWMCFIAEVVMSDSWSPCVVFIKMFYPLLTQPKEPRSTGNFEIM